MVIFPNAKINLGLRILRKRPDGYHDLETCFYPIPYFDILEILPSNLDSFHAEGIEIPGENLVKKAINALRERYNFPKVEVYLYKNIPIGAGLGGGSSDAGFMLKAINEFFGLNIATEELENISGTIGKDCPFFIRNRPVLAYETGNRFEELNLDLKGFYLIVVTPPIQINTAEAFTWVTPSERRTSLKDILENTPLDNWEEKITNDFQPVVEKKFPEIKEIRPALRGCGCFFTALSGSGSSVIGLSRNSIEVNNLFPPNYKIWSGRI